MRVKFLSVILLTGLVSFTATAGFEQFSDEPVASINQYSLGDMWEQWMAWDAPNLIAETTDNRTFTLKPNISAYVNDPEIYANGSGDGTKKFDQLLLFERNLNAADTRCTITFTVTSNTLDPRYDLNAVFSVINPATGYQPDPTFTATATPITTNGTYTVTSSSVSGRSGMILQAGFSLYGRNAAPSNEWGSATLTVTDISVGSSDFTAPTPDPMTFVSAVPISDSAISVTATTATDNSAGVEYYFWNFTADTVSGWQSSSVWMDTGPSAGTVLTNMPIVNSTFDTDGTGWEFEQGTGLASWTNLSADGAAFMTVDSGGWSVLVQSVDLTETDFSGGDTITFSADCMALDGLANGGVKLKIESWGSGSKISDSEVPVPVAATGWDTLSTDYTIAGSADEIKLVLVLTPTSGSTSSYAFDNIAVSGEVTLPAGLSPETEYTYYVKARDTTVNTNQTGWSNPGISATTPAADNLPPEPAVMSFVGTDASPNTIKLTAVTATDATSGVEYFFECVAGPGNDSGWQSSPVYYDTGLASGSNYSYTVVARDTSFNQWTNTVSSPTNITTMTVTSGSYTNTLIGYTGNTGDQGVLMNLEKDGLTTGSTHEDAIVEFSASGATFGDGLGTTGRNVLKTIASEYGDVSFEAYATFTFSGQSDLSGFIGMGQGVLTGVPDNWGVPELNMAGVNGVVGQFKDSTAGDIENINSTLFKFVGGDPDPSSGGTNIASPVVSSTETILARLTYDAAAETVNVSFDKNYTGGAFTADQDMGTVSTSLTDTNGVAYSMWEGAPVSVYVGGGEGTVVKGFYIISTGTSLPPQPPFDIQAVGASAAGGMVFSWDGVSGRTYEVQYKTNLVTDVEWMTDPSPGASGILSAGGSISATSTVDSASVFYRIISE